ncbi:MAG TPA: amidohydrolase family protein [Longimicrobiales bacterium]|nr:amidohydrolase family protein [Longimicrobiales bacterium]
MTGRASTARRAACHPLALLPLVLPAGACTGNGAELVPLTDAYSLLIENGTLVDGTGAPARSADVLILGDSIAFVGDVDADTIAVRETFDASGLVVAPGFIDAHAHGDPVAHPAFPNFLAMGVTTILLGQDGGSPPVAGLAAHLDSVDAARPDVNVAYLIGHNTIREESGVGFGAPSQSDLARLADLVQQGLEAGAFGLSTGLEYDPGSRAEIAELVAIAEPVAAAGGVVTSHMRSEDADRVAASLDELLEQGRRARARVHVSHIKVVLADDTARAGALLARMAAARDAGISVTADVYPYVASYTGIGLLFPAWAKPPNDYAAVVASRRGELAAHLRNRVEGRNGPEATLFGSGKHTGRTLAEVAAAEGRPYEDVLIDIGPGGASAAYFVMAEPVMRRFLADPHVAVSSDGSPTMQHPRGHGAFARVIGRYVVEDASLDLAEAVRKMSGLTASIFRLDDREVLRRPRGRLEAGFAADVVAFDPGAIRDRATFEAPHVPAAGMRAVWVNGQRAWSEGEPVGEAGRGAGRALRARP